MNPASLIPVPDPVPGNWGWFKALLILSFVIHILLMNIMVGGGIIAFFGRFTKRFETHPMEKEFSNYLTIIIAVAVNFGVATLLFLQVLYGQYFYISSQLMAVYWLSTVALVIIAYYGAYYYKFRFDELKTYRGYLIGSIAAIFILIGFVFVNNVTTMMMPKYWVTYFREAGGFFLNLSEPSLLPRFLHFMTASVAIGGLFIAVVWSFKQKKWPNYADSMVKFGMKWFTYATMFQIIIGFWFQISLPKPVFMMFMGKSVLHTSILAVALALIILTLYFSMNYKVLHTVMGVLGVVSVMAIIRDLVRTAYLSPYPVIPDTTEVIQYSPMIVFLVSLGGTAILIAHVIRLAMRTQQQISAS